MRFAPHTDEDVRAMLGRIGAGSIDDLFASIPASVRLDRPLGLSDGFPPDVGRVRGDNAFGLAAGAERRIFVHAGEGSLGGLSVRAWNADAVPVSAAGS